MNDENPPGSHRLIGFNANPYTTIVFVELVRRKIDLVEQQQQSCCFHLQQDKLSNARELEFT